MSDDLFQNCISDEAYVYPTEIYLEDKDNNDSDTSDEGGDDQRSEDNSGDIDFGNLDILT